MDTASCIVIFFLIWTHQKLVKIIFRNFTNLSMWKLRSSHRSRRYHNKMNCEFFKIFGCWISAKNILRHFVNFTYEAITEDENWWNDWKEGSIIKMLSNNWWEDNGQNISANNGNTLSVGSQIANIINKIVHYWWRTIM